MLSINSDPTAGRQQNLGAVVSACEHFTGNPQLPSWDAWIRRSRVSAAPAGVSEKNDGRVVHLDEAERGRAGIGSCHKRDSRDS